jgi:hypothetical protein
MEPTHSPQGKYFPEAATIVNVKRNMPNEISVKWIYLDELLLEIKSITSRDKGCV